MDEWLSNLRYIFTTEFSAIKRIEFTDNTSSGYPEYTHTHTNTHLFVHMYMRVIIQRRHFVSNIHEFNWLDWLCAYSYIVSRSALEGRNMDGMKTCMLLAMEDTQYTLQTSTMCWRASGAMEQVDRTRNTVTFTWSLFSMNPWLHS